MPRKVYSKEYHQSWRKKNQKNYQISQIKYKFKVTKEEAAALLKAIEGRCSICGNTWSKKLCIDHDHRTGRIRGVLCHNCNVVLGFVDDRIDILERMVKYLAS